MPNLIRVCEIISHKISREVNKIDMQLDNSRIGPWNVEKEAWRVYARDETAGTTLVDAPQRHD